jgi:hypothetical protein
MPPDNIPQPLAGIKRKPTYMKIGILIVLIFFSAISFGQKITDIFRMLPNDCFHYELSDDSRTELLKNMKYYPASNCKEESIVFSLVDLDTLKNFVRIEMSYESGQAAYTIYEIRSFKKSGGSQIVIFSNVSGANIMYGQNILQTFEITDNKLVESKIEYLPINIGIKDFVKIETPDSLILKYENSSSHSYKLGYYVKNITYELNDFYLHNSDLDSLYLLGNKIEFVWENDKFDRKPVEKKE